MFTRLRPLSSALLPVLLGAACSPTFVVDTTPALSEPAFLPALICQEQNGPDGTTLLLAGEGMSPTVVDIPNDPAVVLPSLTLTRSGALDGAAGDGGVVEFSGATGGANAALVSWQSQQQMSLRFTDTFDLGDDTAAMPQGLYDLTLTNPDGQTVASLAALAVVERPHVLHSEPALVCLAQGDRTLTIGTRGALTVDGAVPVVTIGDQTFVPTASGCVDIAQSNAGAAVCDALTVTVPQGALSDGPQPISILNPAPADCESSGDDIDVVIVAPPAIAGIEPAAVCADAGIIDVVVSGSGFLVIDSVAFAVTVNGTAATPVPSGCTPVVVNGGSGGPGTPVVQSCTAFSISVDTAAVPVGGVTIAVENPAPAGCSANSSTLLRVDPVPALASVEPAGVCQGSGDVALTVDGDGFAVLDGVVFGVTVAGVVATAVTPGGCVDIDAPGVTLQSCTSFTAVVDSTGLAAGATDIVVTNPGPDACGGSDNTLFSVAPAPVIRTLSPQGVCSTNAGVVDVVVDGDGFLVVDGVSFTVAVGGTNQSVTPVGCIAVPDIANQTIQSCTSFSLTIDATGLPPGDIDIVVDNPDLPGCLGQATAAFSVLPPPTVTGVSPAAICSDVASVFAIQGTGLADASTVLVGDRSPDRQVANADQTELTLTFDAGLPAGVYPISVSNGDGCEATSNVSLTVNPTPLVFFVNPPVTYNGIAIEATVFASGLAAAPASVELVDDAGEVIDLAFADSGRPGRVLATVAAGLSPGDYAVRVTSEFQCASIIDGALSVTDQLTLAIGSIEPAFASPTVATSVTLRTVQPLPNGQEGFQNVPQVYLNPANGNGTAIALRAVELVDATTLNAIVTGAAAGVYDVVVVNPDGAVGFLPGALTVTVAEPSRVTSVAPASLNANRTSAVTVFGANFDVVDPTVSLECQDFITSAVVPVIGAITVTTATASSLDVSVDATGISAGAVCVVVVENSDGAIARFSALSFKQPSQNLNDWRAASPMVEARRALVLAAGRPTDTSRFIFAIGGDAGTVSTAKISVEAAPVDAFGTMGSWSLQRNTLQNAVVAGVVTASPRTQAGVASVGRFVYVVGGDDGSGAGGAGSAVSSVLRAQILDPLAGPEILDLGAALSDGVSGLTEGLWIYRVAAIFPLSDVNNPGGESLGGELFNVVLPAVPERLALDLSWQSVAGASGYRLYRSPVPDVGPERLELLAETTDTAFNDDGTRDTVAVDTPLPAGSLGVWHAVAPLNTPRAAQATVAVPNPNNSAEVFVYAVGGRTTGGTVIGSGEVATLTLAPDGSQTLSSWRALTASLNPARAELAGLAITPADTPAAGTQSLLVFTTGRRGNGTLAGTVEATRVSATGDITAYIAQSTPNPTRAGAGGLSANGFLFLFGGANGNITNNDVSTSLVNSTPTLDGWNGLGGGSMLTARRLLGTAQESAFLFLGGGEVSAGVATNSVEQTIQ